MYTYITLSRSRFLAVVLQCFALILLITSNEVFAWVIPGTISKGSYITSNTCNMTATPYFPFNAGGDCYQWDGKTGHTEYYQCNGRTVNIPDQCGLLIPTWITDTCDRWIWDTYYSLPIFSPSGSNTFYSYSYNAWQPTWGQSGNSVILGNDAGESCSRSADGTPHTPPSSQPVTQSCTDGASAMNIYTGGSNGVCNTLKSTDNLVTSFNQLGNITRSAPTDNDAACTVEGRYAQGDSGGPDISTTGLGVFDGGDQDNWCNMNKYRNGEITPGCLYYANRAGAVGGGDLLSNLSVVVNDADSGISSVTVELGACSGRWDLPTDLGTILNSTTAATGVKSLYKKVILSANAGAQGDASFTIWPMGMVNISSTPASLPSLKAKFGVTRLDDCLREGKNFLVVSASDSARSSADGITFAPNLNSIDYASQGQGYIKIDNTSPKLGLGGDMAYFAESNIPASCFVWNNAVDEGSTTEWKNFTLNGTIRTTDPFGNDIADCQTNTTATNVALVCTVNKNGLPKPSDASVIWSAPAWVHPTNGAFTGKTFGSIGPIPAVSSCDWSCIDPAKKYDVSQGKCISTTKLLILFDAGSTEANGPLAAKLDGDLTRSVGLLKEKTASCPAPSPAGMSSFTNYRFAAGAAYTFPSDTTQYQIAENGSLACPWAAPIFTYTWFTGDFGSCTGACGTTGTQNRQVYCKRSDGAVSADSLCTGTKPAMTQSCSVGVCPAVATSYSWQGDWGACTTILPIQRTRILRCESNLGVTVADAYCAGVPRPAAVDTTGCTVNYCTAGGTVPCIVKTADTVVSIAPTCVDGVQNGIETWVDCGGSCGVCTSSIGTWSCTTSGTAANINSFLLGGVIGTDVGLNGCTPVGSKKAYSLGGPGANYCTCNSNVSTYTYSWSSGSYGTCSTSCWWGIQTRTVTCLQSDGTTVADALCSGAGVKPTISQDCNTNSCLTLQCPIWTISSVGRYLSIPSPEGVWSQVELTNWWPCFKMENCLWTGETSGGGEYCSAYEYIPQIPSGWQYTISGSKRYITGGFSLLPYWSTAFYDLIYR